DSSDRGPPANRASGGAQGVAASEVRRGHRYHDATPPARRPRPSVRGACAPSRRAARAARRRRRAPSAPSRISRIPDSPYDNLAMRLSPATISYDGPIVIIGFGSIGKGALPLILRHIDS